MFWSPLFPINDDDDDDDDDAHRRNRVFSNDDDDATKVVVVVVLPVVAVPNMFTRHSVVMMCLSRRVFKGERETLVVLSSSGV